MTELVNVGPDDWPEAVTDGPALPCFDCNRTVWVDFRVGDEAWRTYVPERDARLSVLCWGCYVERGGQAGDLIEAQMVSAGQTVVMAPERGYRYSTTSIRPITGLTEGRTMGDDVKRMDIAKFREFGYLQELNRGFLHPLGLALEVVVEDDGTERLGGIWDYRDDPEGIRYEGIDLADKAQRVADERERRRPSRVASLGYWQQPPEAGSK